MLIYLAPMCLFLAEVTARSPNCGPKNLYREASQFQGYEKTKKTVYLTIIREKKLAANKDENKLKFYFNMHADE